jgi:hypothetical protein
VWRLRRIVQTKKPFLYIIQEELVYWVPILSKHTSAAAGEELSGIIRLLDQAKTIRQDRKRKKGAISKEKQHELVCELREELYLRAKTVVGLVKPYVEDWFKANFKAGAVTERTERGKTGDGDAIGEENNAAAAQNGAVDDSNEIANRAGGNLEASTAGTGAADAESLDLYSA